MIFFVRFCVLMDFFFFVFIGVRLEIVVGGYSVVRFRFFFGKVFFFVVVV